MNEDKKISLWLLAWPVFIEMFLQFLLGTVDTLMISRISDNAVAVVGLSLQLFNAVNILFMAFSSGTGILVAQRLGARKEAEARSLALIGMKASIGFGALLSVLMLAATDPIAGVLQVPEALRPLFRSYVSIVGGGMIFLAAMDVLGSIVRSTGNTRGPMYIAAGMNVLHFGMNYVVITGAFGFPQLGLAGVAASTLISRVLGALVLLYLFRNAFAAQIKWKDLRFFDRALFRETFAISWPLGINMSSWTFTQLVIYAFIAMLGAEDLAARTYMNAMESFCFMIGYAIALAGQIRISHLYGSGDLQPAYRTAYRVLWIGLAVVMVNTLLLNALGRPVIHLFTHDAHIVALCVSLLGINLLLQPGKMLNMTMGNALMAVGDTRYVMVTGIFSMWLVAVGVSWLAGLWWGWGLFGIYAAMIMDEYLRGIFVLFRWRSRKFMGTGRHGRPDPAAETASLSS